MRIIITAANDPHCCQQRVELQSKNTSLSSGTLHLPSTIIPLETGKAVGAIFKTPNEHAAQPIRKRCKSKQAEGISRYFSQLQLSSKGSHEGSLKIQENIKHHHGLLHRQLKHSMFTACCQMEEPYVCLYI